MPKVTFKIQEVKNVRDVEDLVSEFTKKMMNALEIGTTKDEKVLSDIEVINEKLADDDIEIKQNVNYLNPWKMFSSYGTYLRGIKEYDSIKKWYNGYLTKEQLDNALEVMKAFKETFNVEKIQDKNLKNELLYAYQDIYALFNIKGINPDEIKNYDEAENKNELVNNLIETSKRRNDNIQIQKNEIDAMDKMYKPILDGFKNKEKNLTESEEGYLHNHNLELVKNGSDQREILSLQLDYIKEKYGRKAAKLITKGAFATFNKRKLTSAIPFLKSFFNYKITGLGNNKDFYSTNTQYGSLKSQIEHHLLLKGLNTSDIKFIKSNDFNANDIIGKAKVNRNLEYIKNKVKDLTENVNKKNVKSTLKAIHKSLKLIKDINKGKLGNIASKDSEEIAKSILKETATFMTIASTNDVAKRSLNWFNRRELRTVTAMKEELSSQIKIEEPKTEIVEEDNELRRSTVIDLDNELENDTPTNVLDDNQIKVVENNDLTIG